MADPDPRCASLPDLLKSRAARSGAQDVYLFPDGGLTYAELLDRASALAKGLIAAGLERGEHVGIMMPNHRHFVLAHFAVQLAGGRSILFNARFKTHELQQVTPRVDLAMMITTDAVQDFVDFRAVIEGAFPAIAQTGSPDALSLPEAPTLRRLVRFGPTPWPAALSDADLVAMGRDVPDATLEAAHADLDPEDTAVMIFTSGTTAAPKACELSAASLQRAWRTYVKVMEFREGEKMWDPMPMFHSGGIGLMTGIMEAGGTILTTAHFDPDEIARLIGEHRIEHLYPGFHTLSLPVLQSRHYDRDAWAGFVKSMVNVGPLGTQRLLRDMLPAGVPILNLFGMSESSGLLMLAPREAEEDVRLTSAGRPRFGAEMKIVTPETLEELGPEQPGEILFRGAGAFRGYYRNPEATAATILPDGWVRTGDLGKRDADGNYYYIGRLKDMLKVGGENMAAAELEAFLSGHPAVKFVQVIGREDARMGEVPVAFVELNPGATAAAAEIIDWCAGKIATFKIPRDVIFVTEWPMSATKIQKFRLKDLLPA